MGELLVLEAVFAAFDQKADEAEIGKVSVQQRRKGLVLQTTKDPGVVLAVDAL